MDSLRALAVLCVLVQHWFGNKIPAGSWGVSLFFVISGYLISGSLLRFRDEGVALIPAAVDFFRRRSARLFPAYYLTLLVAVFLYPRISEHWVWYAGYATNFLMNIRQEFIPLIPTWSLAVEEQFYIAWFFAMMLIPFRFIPGLIFLLIITAPIVRYIGAANGNVFTIYLPWANCDALSAGALLCLLERKQAPVRFLYGTGAVGFILFAVSCALLYPQWDPIFGVFGALVPSAIVICSSYLVWGSRLGFHGVLGKVLDLPVLNYLGKISYGIYLYHMIAPMLAKRIVLGVLFVLQRRHLHQILSPGLNEALLLIQHLVARLVEKGTCIGFLFQSSVAIIIAALSLKYFEMPIRVSQEKSMRKSVF